MTRPSIGAAVSIESCSVFCLFFFVFPNWVRAGPGRATLEPAPAYVLECRRLDAGTEHLRPQLFRPKRQRTSPKESLGSPNIRQVGDPTKGHDGFIEERPAPPPPPNR